MALTITHAKVSTAGPAADPDKVGGDDWNDDHVLIGDYLRKATVTLSSAQILDLHNTPITLVAAPGAGKFVVPHEVVAYYSFGTIAYTASGEAPTIRWGGSVSAGDAIMTTSRLTGTVDAIDHASGSGGGDASGIVDIALQAKVTDGSFADGDGTLTVTVWYSIEDVPA